MFLLAYAQEMIRPAKSKKNILNSAAVSLSPSKDAAFRDKNAEQLAFIRV
jgi:hypothetical protein